MEKIIFLPLETEEQTEIAIVGGGICGLLTAYLLSKEGKSVSVYEKFRFGESDSIKMPEIMQYDATRSFSGLKKHYGYEAALNFYRISKKAIFEIKNAAEEVGYKDTVIKDCFTFSDGGVGEEEMEEEYRLLKYGGFDIELINGKDGLDLFSFPFECGIYSASGGIYADKSTLCEKLLCYLSIKGVKLYENTEIKYITQKEDKNGFYLESDSKVSVLAEKVIDCRGISLLSRYPFLGKREAVFTVKTKPVVNFDGWYNRAFLKDTYEKPLYFMVSPNGSVSVSGYDIFFPRKEEGILHFIFEKLKERRIEGLKETLIEYFYPLSPFEFEKEGFASFLKTYSLLPAAAEDKERKGYYFITSGNKNILLSSWLASNALTELIRGNKPEEFELIYNIRRYL